MPNLPPPPPFLIDKQQRVVVRSVAQAFIAYGTCSDCPIVIFGTVFKMLRLHADGKFIILQWRHTNLASWVSPMITLEFVIVCYCTDRQSSITLIIGLVQLLSVAQQPPELGRYLVSIVSVCQVPKSCPCEIMYFSLLLL